MEYVKIRNFQSPVDSDVKQAFIDKVRENPPKTLSENIKILDDYIAECMTADEKQKYIEFQNACRASLE